VDAVPVPERNFLASVRYRTGAVVDAILDRIVTEPFDIASSEEAVALMSEPPPESALFASIPTLATLAARGGTMYRRFRTAQSAGSAAGGPATVSMMVLTAAAVATMTRFLTSVRWGLRDIQVMASYLSTRSRAQGIALEPGLARSLTISAYLDPRRHPGLDYANVRGAGALVGAWSTGTIASRGEAAARRRAQDRIDALDRYELTELAQEWKTRHGAG
jgi:hypothetical protein